MKTLAVTAAVVTVLGIGLALWIRSGPLAAEPPNVAMRPAGVPHGSVSTEGYDDGWDALRSLDFPAAERLGLNPAEDAFASALRRIREGRFDAAIQALRALRGRHAGTPVGVAAHELLRDLLVLEEHWDDLGPVTAEGPVEGAPDQHDRNAHLLATAFAELPPERYELSDGGATVDASPSWTGVPVVTASVNGRRYKLWLDTGASHTVLAADLAAEAGIEAAEVSAGRGHTSTRETVAFRPAVVRELTIGRLVIRNHRCLLVDEDDLRIGPLRIQGVLGWPLFRSLRVEIDYTGDSVTFGRSTPRAEEERNLVWLGYPMVLLRSASGAPLLFGLDTGARTTSPKEHLLRRLRLEGARERRLHAGAGGAERVATVEISEKTLYSERHALTFRDVSTTRAVRATFVEPDGKLGSDAGRLGGFVLDFPNGRFELRVD